jgi:L-fuculose-phosphate aldolase
MRLQKERGQVVFYCRKIKTSGLTAGTSGNISIFNPDSGLFAISPSSMDYDKITPEDVVILDLDGRIADGRRRPSTESDLHLACYKHRKDIAAVVHTHSPKATTLAVLGWDLPAVHYMVALGGDSAIPCAPYHLFGTSELAQAAVQYLEGRYACLLANHGVLSAGPDIGHAYTLAEQIEFCADVYLRAKAAGTPNILSDRQIADVMSKLGSYTKQD